MLIFANLKHTLKRKDTHIDRKLQSTMVLMLLFVPPLNVPECIPFYFENTRKETACRVTITTTMQGAVNNYIVGMTDINFINFTEAHMEHI